MQDSIEEQERQYRRIVDDIGSMLNFVSVQFRPIGNTHDIFHLKFDLPRGVRLAQSVASTRDVACGPATGLSQSFLAQRPRLERESRSVSSGDVGVGSLVIRSPGVCRVLQGVGSDDGSWGFRS